MENDTVLDHTERETFARCLHQTFRIHAGSGEAVDAELIAVESLGGADAPPRGTGQREPFSLIFRGPREAHLSQQIFQLEHETLGTLALFLVPIGADEHGIRFEAIFN